MSRPPGRDGALRDGWRLSFGTLTMIPVRPPAAVDPAAARVAMTVAPLAVLPVAVGASLVGLALALLGTPDIVAGFAAVGALALGTRLIHADGLADTADGLGCSWDRDRALDVMRRGDVGPMGAATLVVVLGVQAACAGDLLRTPGGWLLLAGALALSRAALVIGTRRGVPAARPEGLGQAVAGTVPAVDALVVWVLGALALSAGASALGRPWWQAAVAVTAAAAAALAVLAWVSRRLGGITGDVLGALVEVSATVLLVGLATG